LRGHAEAEWNLLNDEETRDFERVIHNLREWLDHCVRYLQVKIFGAQYRQTVRQWLITFADWRKHFVSYMSGRAIAAIQNYTGFTETHRRARAGSGD